MISKIYFEIQSDIPDWKGMWFPFIHWLWIRHLIGLYDWNQRCEYISEWNNIPYTYMMKSKMLANQTNVIVSRPPQSPNPLCRARLLQLNFYWNQRSTLPSKFAVLGCAFGLRTSSGRQLWLHVRLLACSEFQQMLMIDRLSKLQDKEIY